MNPSEIKVIDVERNKEGRKVWLIGMKKERQTDRKEDREKGTQREKK